MKNKIETPRHYYDMYYMYKDKPKPPPKEEKKHPILDLEFSPYLVLILLIWFLVVAIFSMFVGAMDY